MAISLILLKKILSLFLILFLGYLLVRLGLVRAEDSRPLSLVTLYLIMPCAILNAFQVDAVQEVRRGLVLAAVASAVLQIAYIPFVKALAKPLHLDSLEQVASIYSNAGNLVIPLVTAVLGEQYVIYASAYMSIQLVLLWSHARSTLCGETRLELKKVFANVNMIAIFVGLVLFFTGFRITGPVADAVSSLSSMLGPISMLVMGMLFGGMTKEKLFCFHRLPLVCLLRLIILPVASILLLRLLRLAVPDADQVLLTVALATMTPTAATVTQMAQIYGCDADYASAINVVSTLGCLITMPLMVLLYQL